VLSAAFRRARFRAYVPDRGAGRALALVTLVDSVGTGLYLAGAAIFLARSLDVTPAQVGLGLSIGAAVGFATTMPIGVAGDRLGARRLLVLFQLWRAASLVALVFVSGIVSFTVVAAFMAVAEAATPSLTQAVVASAVASESRVRNMAILRSIRNVGFSLGALMAAPLITAGSGATLGAIVLGDALSFVVAALILAGMPLVRVADVRRRPAFLTALGSFRDWRYASLASLNGVLTLHMTILVIGIPLWLIHETRAPASLVAALVLLNTVMAVVLQVPFARHATLPGGGPRVLRLAGVMLAACALAIAAAQYVTPLPSAALLVLATAFMSLAEIWQAGGAWELSYRYADPERELQYLAVFSLGLAAQDIVGPALVTAVVIGAGTAGWTALAALFLVATLLVGPVTSALERESRRAAMHDLEEEPCCALTA
jgi:MFS family permease